VQDGFTSSYRLLIVKSGAKPSEAPASFYSVKVDSAQPNGDPIPFRDFSQTYAPWNTGMSLKLDTVNGKGYILVERFGSSPADLSFSGTAPRHVSRYRWTIDPFGITSIQGNTWLEIENQVFANGITDPHTVTIYWRPTIGAGPFTALPTSYQFVAPTSKTAPESTLVSAGTHFGEYVLGSDENGLLTDVSHRTPASPALFSLAQNYPNPFNPTTVIQFSLPRSSDVRIDVFNVVGQKVRSLFAAQAPGGLTTLQFDGRDTQGRNLPSGVYIYRMTAGQFLQAKKMLLVR
jgi:hypothetical protein